MLRTRLCDLFGIKHPIISAPMAGSAGADLASAVSKAGGLGMIGGSTGNATWLRDEINRVRQQTHLPFGVGFITSAPGVDDLMEVALELSVPVISHSFADATPYIKAAREIGTKTIVQVQSVEQAVAAASAGADAIAAQGMEAGGHTGNVSAVLPLLPAVVDAVGNVPVVAAGGIADGRGLAAVLMLGGEGAWIGTRFVASNESFTANWIKQRIAAASVDDLVLTQVYDIVTQAPFPGDVWERVLRNDFTETWHGREDDVIERRSDLFTETQAALADANDRLAKAAAGNSAGLINGIESAGDIVQRIVDEAEAILRSRPRLLLG